MSAWNRAKGKFGNQRVETDGYSFASKLEASVYQILKLREKAGELKILQAQDHVYLTDARIGYIPDFKCEDLITGLDFWVEAKGYASDVWPLKKKLWKFYGPGKLEVWKGTHQRPFLDETITPKSNEASGTRARFKKDGLCDHPNLTCPACIADETVAKLRGHDLE